MKPFFVYLCYQLASSWITQEPAKSSNSASVPVSLDPQYNYFYLIFVQQRATYVNYCYHNHTIPTDSISFTMNRYYYGIIQL